MDRSEPCDLCGTSEFYEEDGYVYCSNGHTQGPIAATEGDLDFGRVGGKVLRKKKQEKNSGQEKVSRVFKGRAAYRLFLKAWGYVLWKQCYALVHGKGLPGELWEVVRALWTLRVGALKARYDEDVGDVEGFGRASSAAEIEGRGMEREMTETETEAEEQGQQQSKRKASDSPSLIDVAALNYLGVLILRYPLELSTLFSWLEDETIPFIRAIRHVPQEIKDHLPAEYHQALDTYTLIAPQDLRDAVSRMAAMYTSTFGVTIPPLNFHIFLLSYIETLALPLQIYRTVKHLNTILNFSFAYPASQSTRSSASTYPEAQLMALIVVATKLLFPFDSSTIKRYPQTLNAPGALRMNWDAWLDAKRAYDDALASSCDTAIVPGTEMALKDTDILDMNAQQLDEYMDWYQRMWANHDRKEEGVQKRILDMFPLKSLAQPSREDVVAKEKAKEQQRKELKTRRVKCVQASLRTRRAVSDGEEGEMMESGRLERQLMRPGDGYQIFQTVEALGEGVERVFHEEAARAVGISVEILVRVVRSTEDRVEKWRRERRREEPFREAGVGGGGGGRKVDGIVDVEMEDVGEGLAGTFGL